MRAAKSRSVVPDGVFQVEMAARRRTFMVGGCGSPEGLGVVVADAGVDDGDGDKGR